MGENITSIHVSLQEHQQENAATLDIWNSVSITQVEFYVKGRLVLVIKLGHTHVELSV